MSPGGPLSHSLAPVSNTASAEPAEQKRGRLSPALLLGALGVVYGDIGTSPLYAYKEAVKAAGGGTATPLAVTGAVSLIFGH